MANKVNVEQTSYFVTCSDHGWRNEFPPCGWSGTLSSTQLKTGNIHMPNDPHPISRRGFICPSCGAFIPLEDLSLLIGLPKLLPGKPLGLIIWIVNLRLLKAKPFCFYFLTKRFCFSLSIYSL